jgi:hypothetical protein
VQPYSSGDGTGTALDVVLTAKDMSGNVLATADQQYFTNGDDAPKNDGLHFAFPMDDQFGNKFGSTYTLEVTASNKTAIQPTKNFYIMQHVAGPFNFGQPELEGPAGMGMNDTVATAETLKVPSGQKGIFAIDGNLSSLTDVDWYTMAVPAGAKTAFLNCSAVRDGSGLIGFTAELFKDAAGTNMLITVGPEPNPAKDDTALQGPAAGATITGITTMTLKISLTGAAAGQDPNNKGTFYNCFIATQ